MSSYHLKVTSRNVKGKETSKQMRAMGDVPGVIYGHKEEPVKIAVNARELRDMIAHGGQRGLLVLEEEGGVNETAILKSVHRHPAKNYPYSVDFQRVSRDETIHTVVPIVLVGETDAVRVEGGIMVQAQLDIEISSRPGDIPDHIEADISRLEVNGAPILVSDLSMPNGVVAITDGETPVAVVNPPVAEEVEPLTPEEAEAEAAAADEVPSEHGSDGESSDTAAEASAE